MANSHEHDDFPELPAGLVKHLKSMKDERGLQDLMSYASSSEADIEAPMGDQDLSLPLSNYYISSSHNTYLTGNQLYSDSSVDGYVSVLRRGCRCVEIDIWDGKAADDSSSSEDEHGGLRERLGFSRRHTKKKPPPDDDKGDSHHGLGKHMHLHRKDSATATGPGSGTANTAAEPEKLSMPTPWTANLKPRVEPRVLHGYTLTKEVTFRHVCEAIREHAFVASDLPLIASLEVHASLEQQQLIVEIIRQVWSDHLLDPPTAGADIGSLPSPDQLRKKILIKVKYSPPESAKKHQEQNKAGSGSDEDESVDTGDPKKPAKKKKMLDELSALGVYTRSYHFRNFDSKEARVPTHIFALSENAIDEAIEQHQPELLAHNRDYLMRVYPKGIRFSSSNLDPIPMWCQGVQLVALNWQRHDQATILNEAMFSGTGGWVSKPLHYRSNLAQDTAKQPPLPASVQTTSNDPATTASVATKPRVPSISHPPLSPLAWTSMLLNLTVTIYAAQSLPLPPDVKAKHFRPFVKVILHTDSADPTRSRDESGSRSPSPDPHSSSKEHHVTSSALDRASSLLHRGRSSVSTGSKGKDKSGDKSKAKAVSKAQFKARTTRSHGCDPDFNAQVLHFEDVAVEELGLVFVRFKLVHDIEMGRDDVAGWACVRLQRLRQGLRTVKIKDVEGVEGKGRVLVKVEWNVRELSSAGQTSSLPIRTTGS